MVGTNNYNGKFHKVILYIIICNALYRVLACSCNTEISSSRFVERYKEIQKNLSMVHIICEQAHTIPLSRSPCFFAYEAC